MRTTDPEVLAKIAYEAFADAVEWRDVATGANLPAWKDLPGPAQAVWFDIAMAVRDAT